MLELGEVQRLADEGRLAEAEQYCKEWIRRCGPSATAFHLLGLIYDAGGDRSAAADAYRKALYLDPSHYEAIVHFALLLDRLGDAAGAKTLFDRARRLHQENKAAR